MDDLSRETWALGNTWYLDAISPDLGLPGAELAALLGYLEDPAADAGAFLNMLHTLHMTHTLHMAHSWL
jgi:hypothetical protein